jgi:hypothetical protein
MRREQKGNEGKKEKAGITHDAERPEKRWRGRIGGTRQRTTESKNIDNPTGWAIE